MTTEQTETTTAPTRELLATLIERWQEVADAYKTDPPRDDNDRTYNDYRHIYQRNIRDLQHLLDTGQLPCSLMSNEERRRGDCGRIHEDEHDKHGQATTDPEPAGWIGAMASPWGPGVTREQAMTSVVTLHIAMTLLDGKSEEVRSWARDLAHELRREQIDLFDEIGRQLQRRALSYLDIPF